MRRITRDSRSGRTLGKVWGSRYVLRRFEDFFENVAVGFPRPPGRVNRKDDSLFRTNR